jgi:SsrA-binding protein
MGKASLVDSFCIFHGNELFIKGLQIAEYAWGTHYNHEPRRERKLLLQRKELNKLQRKVKESGLTIIALRLFLKDNRYAKLDIALAKGRRQYDKREVIKRKDTQRQLERNMKIK